MHNDEKRVIVVGRGDEVFSTTAPLAGLDSVLKAPSAHANLDTVDLGILKILADDSRTSQREIARQLEMSPSAIGERIAALNEAGVIRGYTIDVDWDALGRGLLVLLAVSATEGRLADVSRYLGSLPEVEEVAVVTGDLDILVRVRVRDHEHLRKFLVTQIWEQEGIRHTTSYISLGEVNIEQRWVPKVVSSLTAFK